MLATENGYYEETPLDFRTTEQIAEDDDREALELKGLVRTIVAPLLVLCPSCALLEQLEGS